MKHSLIPIFIVLIGEIYCIDYCNQNLCPTGKHIACEHNGNFAPSCPKDAVLMELTNPLKTSIVNGFNEKRNFIAGGGHHNHKPACRMATMQWDDELAQLAELNVKQCEMKREACHNTQAYPNSGQNLAWLTYKNKPDFVELIEHSLQIWYDEVNQCKMEYIRKYPQHHTGAVIGHFTAMVTDRNTRVGCAASTYSVSGEDYKVFLMACNFAHNNVMDEPVYEDCAKAATNCTTGRNSKYPNLCSTSEIYNVN
ncbi:antigen 5 like allergen Cul n 1-like isoform X1 [Musca domestica]|uniref:Venom allergen-1 n=1 Tax=Musca domestica TaxID=7370 RepID=A0A1I8MZH7_MUSDO|nr:antigen 5 like allergen Cul n 1-like isoform X1 [Musca domestica]